MTSLSNRTKNFKGATESKTEPKNNTSVYFHGLPESSFPEHSEKDFIATVIALTQKLYEKNPSQKIGILCDAEELNQWDEWLWSVIPESFLPHSLSGFSEKETPAVIYLTSEFQNFTNTESNNFPDILIYLKKSPDLALHNSYDSYDSYDSPALPFEVHHVVGRNPEYREYCRTLFREYKKNGIKIVYQDTQPPP